MNEYVWIATELYPESTVVIVGATEESALRQIVESITREEYEGFVASLGGDEATDVRYNDDPADVLRVWAGERESITDDPDVEGFYIGEVWRVVKAPVVA